MLAGNSTCDLRDRNEIGHYQEERLTNVRERRAGTTAARDRPRKTAIIVAAHEAVFTPASPAPPGTELIILKRMNEAVGRPIKNRSRRVHAPAEKRRESRQKLGKVGSNFPRARNFATFQVFGIQF